MTRLKTVVVGVVAAWACTIGAARAGTSFEFLFSSSRVTDDRQLFLNLAVSDSGYGRGALEPVLPRLRYVEADLPVVLFLARESGRDVDFIVGLRSRGLPWAVVFDDLRVPVDVLFAGIDRDPGPPYGRAWGHWRRSPRTARLSDSDICGLVQVQVGSRLARTSPAELARGSRGPVVRVVADKRGRPYEAGERGHGRGPSKKPKGHGPGR